MKRKHPEILVMGYSEAGMFLRGIETGRVGAVVSIHGAREFGVEWAEGKRLDVYFDDVDVAAEGDVVAVQQELVRRRWEAENGRVEIGPTVEDVGRIVEFAREVREMEGAVLLHCLAGVSRSPGAAVVCLAAWMGEGEERYCVEEVLRLRRGACPHEGLVRMGDLVLGRGGRLAEALRVGMRERG